MKKSELKDKLSQEYDIILDVLKQGKEKGIDLATSKQIRDNKDNIITMVKVGQIKAEIIIYYKNIINED